jgi:CopG family nickel-responsive transcriptional regulator
MKELVRFGVAMEKGLLSRFDQIIDKRGYENRSEALRDLVRKELDREAWSEGKHTVATITLVYDHHVRELTERLTDIQHEFGSFIVSAMHVHLDHDHCLEVIAVKGPARELQTLADRLTQAKGVLSGSAVAAALPAGGHQHRGTKKTRHTHR